MRNYKEHLIQSDTKIIEALKRLDKLAADAITFVVDENDRLIGSLTDGDVRRGLIRGLSVDSKVDEFIMPNPKFLNKHQYQINEVIALRRGNFKVIPVIEQDGRICNVINFRYQESYLPTDAVVMAGGKGSRLKPLTDTTPKPLLKVGDKAIIDLNVDRLCKYGIDDIWLSIGYLGEQLKEHFGSGESRGIHIEYVSEDSPLGTIGAVSKITNFKHDYVLLTNSDILTALNYEDFFLDFLEKDADMSVGTIPYNVDVPYAVMETSNNHVISFKEKPTYTYYSNGGIYLMKREILNLIPHNSFFNSTDLMEKLLQEGGKLISYPIRQYWLDIGKPEDYKKAQEDIKHLNL